MLDKKIGKGVEPKQIRMARQKAVFTNWIVFRLATREQTVNDLYEDLKDGWVLYALLEELSGQSLRPLGKMNKGKMRIQHVANMNIVFKYLRDTVKIVNIGPQDIVDSTIDSNTGHSTLVLGLIWSIIVFFMTKDIAGAGKWRGAEGSSSSTMKGLKQTVLAWVKLHTGPVEGIHAANLNSDLSDGSVLLTILNRVDPDGEQLEILPDDPMQNVSRALRYAEDKYGVPIFVDESDPSWSSDDKVVVPQLVQWMKRLPDVEVLDAERAAEEAEQKRLQCAARTDNDETFADADGHSGSEHTDEAVEEHVTRTLEAEVAAKTKLVEEARLEAEAEAAAATEEELSIARIAEASEANAKEAKEAADKAKDVAHTAHALKEKAEAKLAAAERELQHAAARRDAEAAAIEGGSPDRGAKMRQRFQQEEADMEAEAADLAKAAAEEKAEHDREKARLAAEAEKAARDAEAIARAMAQEEARLATEAETAAKMALEEEEAQKAAATAAADAKRSAKAEEEEEAAKAAAVAETKRIEAELQAAAIKAQQDELRQAKEEAMQAAEEQKRRIREDQERQRAEAKASEEETQAAAKLIEDMKAASAAEAEVHRKVEQEAKARLEARAQETARAKAEAEAAAAAASKEAERARLVEAEAERLRQEAEADAQEALAERQRRQESSKRKSARHKVVARTAKEMSQAAAVATDATSKVQAARRDAAAKQGALAQASQRAEEALESATQLEAKAASAAKSERATLRSRAQAKHEEAAEWAQEADRGKLEVEDAMNRMVEAEAGAEMLRREFRQLSAKSVRTVSRRMGKTVPVLIEAGGADQGVGRVKGSFCAVLQENCEESVKHAAGLVKLKSTRAMLVPTEAEAGASASINDSDETENDAEIEASLEKTHHGPSLSSFGRRASSFFIGQNPLFKAGRAAAAQQAVGDTFPELAWRVALPAAGLGLAVWCSILAAAWRQGSSIAINSTLGPGPWEVLIKVSKNAAVQSRNAR